MKVNKSLVKQVVTAQQSNKRTSGAHTKTRAEVRGGGRKPWKQKGTGNARAGSRRSPIWIGGGITFGPRNVANHKRAINQKMAKLALSQIMEHLKASKMYFELDFSKLNSGKTKEAVHFLKDNNLSGKVLFITNEPSPKIRLAVRNISGVDVAELNLLSAAQLAQYQAVVMQKVVSEAAKVKKAK